MFKKGTIILVPFPFTDLSGNKVRPALIISDSLVGSDIVVLFITSRGKSKEKYLVTILPDSANGLKVDSAIICGKIATLDKKIVLGELGAVSKSTEKLVVHELKKILGLS